MFYFGRKDKPSINSREGKHKRDNCLCIAKRSDVIEQKERGFFIEQEITGSDWIRTRPNKDQSEDLICECFFPIDNQKQRTKYRQETKRR